jgi:hypothetical protein
MEKTIKQIISRQLLFIAATAAIGGIGNAATPSVFSTAIVHPNGIAVSQNGVLVTSQDSISTIYQLNSSGAASTFATLSPAPPSCTVEVYLAISPGLGGFTANNVFAVAGNVVYQIGAGGSPVSVFHDFSTNGVPCATHNGITFDTTGTFGNAIIVTFDNGSVWTLDSSGTATPLTTVPPGVTEGHAVASMAFAPAPGMLIVTQEDAHTVYKISSAGVATVLTTAMMDPESARSVPATLCTFGTTAGAYFTVDYVNGRIISYPATDFTSLTNDVLFPLENFPQRGPGPGIMVMDKTSGALSTFDNNVVAGLQVTHEGSSFCTTTSQQPPPPSGCVLTQGGYKNHFNSKVINFPAGGLTLGTVFYSNTQLNAILQNNAVGGNGLISLAHQLITAQLNIAYGATEPTDVANAIGQANTLIGSLMIPPVGSGYLSPASTGSIETVLDNFNNGAYGQSECTK